jgi:hypothetical protein
VFTERVPDGTKATDNRSSEARIAGPLLAHSNADLTPYEPTVNTGQAHLTRIGEEQRIRWDEDPNVT